MNLCPLIFTGQTNGVYYYICYQCPGNNQVGGQDTRPHVCGIDCTKINDPIPARRKFPKLTASFSGLIDGVVEPAVLGPDAVSSGLKNLIGLDKSLDGFIDFACTPATNISAMRCCKA